MKKLSECSKIIIAHQDSFNRDGTIAHFSSTFDTDTVDAIPLGRF